MLVWSSLRSRLFKNKPLINCPFLSSKLDSPIIKILQRYVFTLSEFLSNVFDERNGQEMQCLTDQRFIPKEITSQEIHTLDVYLWFHAQLI